MPGEDFPETVRMVLDELPDLPHLPELPARGAAANMTGRGLAVMASLGADLQPAGWRLTDSPGVDHRRARSLLAQDLDVLEELTQGYAGRFKVQVAGPWTLAATVEKPRGDKVLSDHGARRELAQALAEGLTGHLSDLHRRLPGAELVVQVDEPGLPAVLGGQVPTASGFGRHRVVHPPEATETLGWVLEAISNAGGTPIVHCCAAAAPLQLFRDAGARGVAVDVGILPASSYDDLAGLIDDDHLVLLGVVPSLDPDPLPTDKSTFERVLRLLDMLGFDPEEVADRLVLSPTCGLAGASPAWARSALQLTRRAATSFSAG